MPAAVFIRIAVYCGRERRLQRGAGRVLVLASIGGGRGRGCGGPTTVKEGAAAREWVK